MDEFLKLFSVRDIVLHIINTLILFVAMTYLVYKPARKFMNARAERVNAETEKAAELKARAQASLSEAEAIRGAADADAARSRADGAARAQQSAEQILSAAKQKADEALSRAHADADAVMVSAQETIQGQALSMAVEIAEKMIGRELSQKDNETLAREFLTKVG